MPESIRQAGQPVKDFHSIRAFRGAGKFDEAQLRRLVYEVSTLANPRRRFRSNKESQTVDARMVCLRLDVLGTHCAHERFAAENPPRFMDSLNHKMLLDCLKRRYATKQFAYL